MILVIQRLYYILTTKDVRKRTFLISREFGAADVELMYCLLSHKKYLRFEQQNVSVSEVPATTQS